MQNFIIMEITSLSKSLMAFKFFLLLPYFCFLKHIVEKFLTQQYKKTPTDENRNNKNSSDIMFQL